MAKISVKYPIGSKVCTNHGGKEGMITAIFIRGKGRAYEFSYSDGDGKPLAANVEEVEISPIIDHNKFGFDRVINNGN